MIVFWKQQLSHTEGDLMTNLCVLSCDPCSQMSSVTQYPCDKTPLTQYLLPPPDSADRGETAEFPQWRITVNKA